MANPTDLLVSLVCNEESTLTEDLRDWFGKGKKGGVGGGGWDRYNTKGERIGKCAAPERGATEGKPKCLSKEKAAQLRAKGGKKAIANAVKRKKAQDPVTDRPGTGNVPKFVSSRITESSEDDAPVFTPEFEEVLHEKNVPTNPSLWSRAKAEAKKRFDVYPSAYGNAFAAKWYKERGGGWRTKKNESNTPHDREWGTDSLVKIYKHDTPGELDEFFGINFKEVGPDLVNDFKLATPGQTPMREAHESLLDIILEAAHNVTNKKMITEILAQVKLSGNEHLIKNPYWRVLKKYELSYDSSNVYKINPTTGRPDRSNRLDAPTHFYISKKNPEYIVAISRMGLPTASWVIFEYNTTNGKYDKNVGSGAILGKNPEALEQKLIQLGFVSTKKPTEKIQKPDQAKKGPYHELLAKAGFAYKETVLASPPATEDKHIYEAEAGPSQKSRIKAFRIDVVGKSWQFYEVTLGGNIADKALKSGDNEASLKRLIGEIKRKNWIRSKAQDFLRGGQRSGIGGLIGALAGQNKTVSSS